MTGAPRIRVLCVDDEPQVLQAIALNLGRRYDIVTATSGAQALELLAGDPTIAVALSDMQMPGLSGAQWFARAKDSGHDAVRMLLTGHADLQSAIDAVNDGAVFRFLTKPCPKDALDAAITAAAEQHRLITAERVLLEQTLNGSIKTLVDVLGFTHPALVGRANRIKSIAVRLGDELEHRPRWQIEVAAMLSHIGFIALPDALGAKLEAGHVLSEQERKLAGRIPAITEQLLGNIPRLEDVRAILAAKDRPPRCDAADPRKRNLAVAANIMHAAELLDALETAGEPHPAEMVAGRDDVDPAIVAAVRALYGTTARKIAIKETALAALRVGMVLAEDAMMTSGALLVARGYEVTPGFLERLRNFMPGAIREPLRIEVVVD
ncbi:MAG TPA: HD domain-containing phosphohydrolase [Kofleriaceae bacterium]|nr:HD domain-containing phosphohydrolase [Kofleriaceae bacterium]